MVCFLLFLPFTPDVLWVLESRIKKSACKFGSMVGCVLKWLKRRAGDYQCHGLKPTYCAILLCSSERHLTALSPAWRCWQVVLNFNRPSIYKTKNRINNFKRTAVTWHLRKQVGVIACLMYSASIASCESG